MTAVFTGTPASLLQPCLAALEAARGNGIDAAAEARRALSILLGLHRQQAVHGALDGQQLARFRADSLPKLLAIRPQLLSRLDELHHLAMAGNGDDWPSICELRSELQCLIDDYPASELVEWLDGERLAEIDTELLALGPQVDPDNAEPAPTGVPESHWWWVLPGSDIGSEAAQDADDPARVEQQSLALMAFLEASLEPLLRALSVDRDGRLAREFAPLPADYPKVFAEPLADAALKAYTALWTTAPLPQARALDARLEIHVSPAGMLADDNPMSRHFPGGYRQLAPHLNPHRVWVAWKLIEPGQQTGIAYDGLVWIDDHWAWFPKAFRVLRETLDALDAAAAG